MALITKHYFWLPLTIRGTVVLIDAEDGSVLGEYRTAPEGQIASPVRCQVDSNFNVFAANRDEGMASNFGSVAQIGLTLGGTRTDSEGNPDPTGQYRKGPFDYSTAIDRDSDGLIRTSTGYGDILSWNDFDGSDFNVSGGPAFVSNASDENIRMFIKTNVRSVRTVAVDTPNNAVWFGGYPLQPEGFESYSTSDGSDLGTFIPNLVGGGFYGVIDSNGIIWTNEFFGDGQNFSTIGVVPIDTNNPGVPPVIIQRTDPWHPILDENEDIWVTAHSGLIKIDNASRQIVFSYLPPSPPVDFRPIGITPSNGHVWCTSERDHEVYRFDPSGNIISRTPLPINNGGNHCIVVDTAENVWAIYYAGQATTRLSRLNPNTEQWDLEVFLPSSVGSAGLFAGQTAFSLTYEEISCDREVRVTKFSAEALVANEEDIIEPPGPFNQLLNTAYALEVLSTYSTESEIPSNAVHNTNLSIEVLGNYLNVTEDSTELYNTNFSIEVLSTLQEPVQLNTLLNTNFSYEVLGDYIEQITEDPNFLRNTNFSLEVLAPYVEYIEPGPTSGDLNSLPEYWRDVYGDATITWVPHVHNYNFEDNVPRRGLNDRTFRWEEVRIELTDIQSGAIIDFTMPDEYIIQITPDIGWHDTLAMFGELDRTDRHNPHLINLGPYSIDNGTLTDNLDNSVQVTITEDQFESSVIDGFKNYLWRAVPWGNGNPGLAGMPESFEFISTLEQLQFVVDPVVKETKKPVQFITGTKSPRVTVAVIDENNPDVFVSQTETSWSVSYLIDRSNVKFTITATDSGGSAIGKYKVNFDHEGFKAYNSHVWNTFDGFALLVGLDRLPNESNESFKARIIDSYTYKGGATYSNLLRAINRELGLEVVNDALTLTRSEANGLPYEPYVKIYSNHTRLSVYATSFIKEEQVLQVDKYTNTITTPNRIRDIISIRTLRDEVIPVRHWTLLNTLEGNEIRLDPMYLDDIKITYSYYEDFAYSEYPTVYDLNAGLAALTNPSGQIILITSINSKLSGLENSANLFKTLTEITLTNPEASIHYSPIGLFAVSDEEYKWSHADDYSMFFKSNFYRIVLELKSKTNIEWGYVVADKDFWDAVNADSYGRDSLPIPFDVPISNFIVPIVHKDYLTKMDPWTAFRMGYYYDSKLIENNGYPREAFRSGVGYKKDCVVGLHTVKLTAETDKINHNATIEKAVNVLDTTASEVSDIIITF